MHTKTQNKELMSLFLLLFLGFIWGTGYSIARFAMTHGVPPLGYSFWQSVGPALILFAMTFPKFKSRSFSKVHLRYYFLCGLTGIVIPNTTMYFASPHLPAGILAVVVNIVPIVAYPLALYAKLEVFHWQRMAGIGLAACGLMFIIFPKSSLPEPQMIPWVLMTLITPFSFAICSIFTARLRPEGSHTFTITFGMLIFSSLLLTPFVFLTHSFYMLHFPLTLADSIIILEIILSSLGYILFFKLIKLAGPVYYSLVDTIVVLTGLFWGYFIFGEQLNKWTTIAVCLILFALFMVTQQQRLLKRIAMPYQGSQ